VGAEKVTPYIHMMLAHIPGEIATHGDLSSFSTQGMEHKNKERKNRAHIFSNKRRRTVVVDGNLARDGTMRGKVVSSDYNVQLMKVEAANRVARRVVPTRKTAAQRKLIQ
jgi:hypothetical protein